MWRLCSFTALILAAPWAAGQSSMQATPLGPGLTDLFEIFDYRVGYQRDGEDTHWLGWGWQGFDGSSGVYFFFEPNPAGGRQLFMHCPWIPGTGITFGEYRLRLPQTSRLSLELQTALRETAPNPDGVTYRVRADGQILWETHCTWKSWREFTVDLSPLAGREVALRLEVDPGPNRNSRDDWSPWGKALLVAGTDEEIAQAMAERARERERRRREEFAAARKLAEADLARFSSRDARSSRPSTAGPVRNRLSQAGDTYSLLCQAPDETIEYRFEPTGGLLGGLQVLVNGGLLRPAPFVGGPRFVLGGHRLVPESTGVSAKLASAEVVGGSLVCRYEYTASGTDDVAILTAKLRPEGKSLVLSLEGTANFDGFTVNSLGATDVPTPFGIGVYRYHPQGVYLSHFVDVWQSDASGIGPAGELSVYYPLTDGTRRPLRDTFYLTVSSRYEETLANIPNPPSPFLSELATRVVLDVWGGAFADNERWLLDMARYGLNRFLIIKHVWQRDGYDHSYPNVMPANAAQGGDEGLRRLSATARRLGHRFCVHENFYDYYPNAEDFRPEDCALTSDGKTIPGWDNGQVQAVILKPSRLMDYARRFSTEVFRRYGCNAAYHDIMPTWHVDFDARVPNSGIVRQTHEYTRQLCEFDRSLFGGPVVFEGIGSHTAGIFDGGCNHGLDTYRTPIAVAFELLKVHPKMSNHGFGYYERWLPWGYQYNWGSYIMTDRELDKYRATEVAFGRTGFIGQQLMRHPHAVVREYYLMQAFGRAYTGRQVRQLAYYADDGGWIDAGTAARYGDLSRLRAIYDGGQEVYVNLSERPWRIANHTLPPAGCLTKGPRATAYTALVDGQIADFASFEDVIFADARSHQWLPPEPPEPITPALGDWKDNGDGTFTVTVNWRVGRRPERDFTIFWHFTSTDITSSIRFQYDHAPPRPTSSWQVGDVVPDGPFTITVPADQSDLDYNFCVGLYDKDGRCPLAFGADSMRIASLRVERQGGRVTRIELRAIQPVPVPGTTREPYLEGANIAKRVLDFGPVATNGAVLLRKKPGSLEIIPVPIGEAVRVGVPGRIAKLRVFDESGKPLPSPMLRHERGKTWFDLPPGIARVMALR